MRRQLIVILAAGLPALVGCGSATTAGSRSGSTDGTVQTTEPDPRSASTDVVALMQFEGGHTTRQTQFTRVPIFAVYGDGRVITVGAQIAIFPGPALPSMQIAQLTSVEVAQIAGSATAAHLNQSIDYGRPGVEDDGDTVVKVLIGGVPREHRAYSLQLGDSDTDRSGLSDGQVTAREVLAEFITSTQRVIEHAVGQRPYVPERYRLWVQPGQKPTPSNDDRPAPTVVPWDITDVALATSKCVAIDGEAASAARALFAIANNLTLFSHNDLVWEVWVRPVLPAEPTCPKAE